MARENKRLRSIKPPRFCACGRRIKRKYHKQCIHCEKDVKRRKKELRELTQSLKQPPSKYPLLDAMKKQLER